MTTPSLDALALRAVVREAGGVLPVEHARSQLLGRRVLGRGRSFERRFAAARGELAGTGDVRSEVEPGGDVLLTIPKGAR